ncbi:efflux transporter outer membrane subunit [Pseudomarimonas arenosa]|uniref:TolC family protein n=1 Tax=Pseudomarimonas arenosa TaxID=2774145 RepID=A0AAW3ZNY4_9GAMM|nr:TolC family protein [Pseudomarimonas arenosa]MBD8526342.1 TolC family protein [Pseudomarimonas arenosa]
MTKHRVSPRLSVPLCAALLSACTVGPQYQRPEQPLPAQFEQAPIVDPQPGQQTMWADLGGAELQTLITRALEANTQVEQAAARLAETRALSGLSVYALFPTVTAAADAERSKSSPGDPFSMPDQGTAERYRAGFDALWEIDLFGSLRNQSRAIYRRAAADQAELAAVQIAVIAETAQTWYARRGAAQQLALLNQQIDRKQQQQALLQKTLEAGRSNALDSARVELELRSLLAERPALENELLRQEQRLAVLTAWPLAELRQHLAEEFDWPPLPALRSVGTPRDWLLRRPDIAAAERRLAAAYSDIGYETAQYFPILNLVGDFGWTAQSFGALGGGASERWRFGPSLSWRFLDFGRVKRYVKAAEARAAGAEAAYRDTVLRALEETENALAQLRAVNQRAAELQLAEASAVAAERLAEQRFEAGADSLFELLDAQRQRIASEREALQARIDQATALVAVYKALAGDFAEVLQSDDPSAALETRS